MIFEIFPWKNLSIMASYRLTGADMNTDNVTATVKNADILVHVVSLYVCYGLNLF